MLLLQLTAHLHHESTENDVRVLVATIVEGLVLLKELIGVSVINILLKEIAGDQLGLSLASITSCYATSSVRVRDQEDGRA